jgi:hypothetical protein
MEAPLRNISDSICARVETQNAMIQTKIKNDFFIDWISILSYN